MTIHFSTTVHFIWIQLSWTCESTPTVHLKTSRFSCERFLTPHSNTADGAVGYVPISQLTPKKKFPWPLTSTWRCPVNMNENLILQRECWHRKRPWANIREIKRNRGSPTTLIHVVLPTAALFHCEPPIWPSCSFSWDLWGMFSCLLDSFVMLRYAE